MSDKANPSEAQRYFGEKIITGEYNSLIIAMEDKEGVIEFYKDGTHLEVCALADLAATKFKREFFKPNEEV